MHVYDATSHVLLHMTPSHIVTITHIAPHNEWSMTSLTEFLSHGAWQPPNTHSVTPNPPTFLTLHQITLHCASHHTVSLDADII